MHLFPWDLRSGGGSGDSPNKRRPNDLRPAVMPTGLAVGLEPPRAPGAAGTACPKDRRAGDSPATVGRDWFPRCSGPRVQCTRLTVSFSRTCIRSNRFHGGCNASVCNRPMDLKGLLK